MNSPFHEGMIWDINKYIIPWLNDVGKNIQGKYGENAVDLAKGIDSTGTPIMKVGEKSIRADCSYSYVPARTVLPGLVVEVSWSGPPMKLRRKAIECIQESSGEIRTVVGFDFSGTFATWEKIMDQWDRTGMPQRGPACVIVWRAVFDRKTGQISLDGEGLPKMTESTYVFCDENGEANLEVRLGLKLQDVISERVLRDKKINRRELRDVELVIDSPTLLGFFDKQLERQKTHDDATRPEREQEEAEEHAKKEKANARRKVKQEKERINVPAIKHWVRKHTYKLRLTKARQQRTTSTHK
ncbi:hypothetical protein F4802DRAFT_571751 [Xylaria palmicola]|nr:hypothetical protein F4802DRAFT_571751 [Xylaria palmicola]